jgi:hypothetical protein
MRSWPQLLLCRQAEAQLAHARLRERAQALAREASALLAVAAGRGSSGGGGIDCNDSDNGADLSLPLQSCINTAAATGQPRHEPASSAGQLCTSATAAAAAVVASQPVLPQ